STSHRSFCLLFLAALSLSVFLVALLNWIVNPLRLFSPRWVPVHTPNYRAEKLVRLKAMGAQTQALLLGSSRGFRFSPSRFKQATGLSAFNASVDVGMAEDFYVFVRAAMEVAGAR